MWERPLSSGVSGAPDAERQHGGELPGSLAQSVGTPSTSVRWNVGHGRA